jgi:ParB-like chromosome segregation protein Spo0J
LLNAIKGAAHREPGRQDRDAAARVAGSVLEQRAHAHAGSNQFDGENGIVAGHARLQAAQKVGLTEVPTIELSWLTPAERQTYVIADNQTAIAGAGWDAEMLRLELGDLKELDFDLTLTGFDEIQLGASLADKTEGLTDPDDVPAVPEHPVSQPGDLWVLGRHRLLCGDSTVATDVERVLGGVAPPSYGHRPALRRELRSGVAESPQPRGSLGRKRHRVPSARS